MSYKEELTRANAALGKDDRTRFVGYGLKRGRAYGTLSDVREAQIIDMPIAENLMVSLAIGLSLKRYRPVVFFERMDFICNAMDAIVNHLDKIAALSRGEFYPAVLIRAMVGNREKALYTGPVHTQDLGASIMRMVRFPVIALDNCDVVACFYETAARDQMKGVSTMLVEYRDLM